MKGRVACMRSIAPVLLLFLPHSSTEFLIGNGTWAIFDVSSQENDLVFARFSLVKFRLHSKAELDIYNSRQVIQLVPFLLETLPTLPLVSPYVAPGLYSKHVNRDRSGETLTAFFPENRVPLLGGHPF